MTHNATVQTQTEGGKKMTTISFMVPGKLKVKALVNENNLIEKVESWSTNPVVGDMLTETTYADYKDFDGVQFPTKITQKSGGFPSLDLTVSEVKPNAPVDIQVPDNVRQASVQVKIDKVADGVWYMTGGTHHSVVVEMKDHLVVIEGPQNDERATAVIAEVKKTVPNKPIKYVVNTHHHFDHAGGLGPFVAEGAIVITHDVNKAFFEQSLAAPRTVQPDKLAQSGKKATVEGMKDKRVLSDETRTIELYHIQGNMHNDGLIMAYLPKEKFLVEADVYTPAAPNAPPPAQPNPCSVNLYDNIERAQAGSRPDLAPARAHGATGRTAEGDRESVVGRRSSMPVLPLSPGRGGQGSGKLVRPPPHREVRYLARRASPWGSVHDDAFRPVNHGCGETHCFLIFLCGHWLKRARIAGLKGVPGQYDSLFNKGWYGYAMVFQTFAQFFEVVRIAEQEPSVLVDRLEGFLCGLLS